jgi:Tfp pilus assembly protein PilZ
MDLRKHLRKPCSTPVKYSSEGISRSDFIQDISNGGVLIQTDGNFFIGQQITLNFTLLNPNREIIVAGKVVRIDPQGIGVKFNDPLADI